MASAGCAGIFGFEELSDRDSSPLDGGSDAAPAHDASTSRADDAGADGATSEPVVADFYVSPQGDDLAEGSRANPLRSVRMAVERATNALDGGPQVIAVCAGDYPERPIAVKGGIAIRGSYDCQAWTRRNFDDSVRGVSFVPSSRLTDAEPAPALIEALSDDATGIPSFEGLTLTVSQAYTGIILKGTGRLSHSHVTNRSLPQLNGAYSVFAVLASGISSEISNCTLRVTSPEPSEPPDAVSLSEQAAYAISVSTGAHVLRRNLLEAYEVQGQGAGISALNADPLVFEENAISVANAINDGAAQTSSAGAYFVGSKVKSTRNSIDLQAPGNRSSYVLAQGMIVSGGSLDSDGDRILGPSITHPTTPDKRVRFYGFHGDGALTRIVNASIYWQMSPEYTMGESAAIRVVPPSEGVELTVAHNTVFFSGIRDGSGNPVRAFALSNEVLDASTEHRITFDSNLVLSELANTTMVRGLCAAPQYVSIAHNRYQGVTPSEARDPSQCSPSLSLEALALDGGARDNALIECDGGSCAELLVLERALIPRQGLRLSPAGCIHGDLKTASDSSVAIDGDGKPRGSQETYIGAMANCP